MLILTYKYWRKVDRVYSPEGDNHESYIVFDFTIVDGLVD